MTITRIWQSGFETGTVLEFDGYGGNTPVITTGGHTGTYRAYGNSRYAWYGKIFVPATRQLRGSFEIAVTGFGNRDTGNLFSIVAGATDMATLGWSVGTEKTSYDINHYVNGGWQGATTSHPMKYNTGATVWQRISFDVKIDPSAGWFKVWIDGILEIDFTGNTGDSVLDEFWLGTSVSANSSNMNWFYDDVYIDDTTGESEPTIAPPVRLFYWVYPDGNGTYSGWMGSDLDQINNYLLVDERPPNGSDYVIVSGVDIFDSYAMTTVTVTEGQTIESVIPISYTQRGESTEKIALGTRYSATDVVGSGQIPGGSWTFQRERQVTKPGGGAWDQVAVDDFEVIIVSKGTF